MKAEFVWQSTDTDTGAFTGFVFVFDFITHLLNMGFLLTKMMAVFGDKGNTNFFLHLSVPLSALSFICQDKYPKRDDVLCVFKKDIFPLSRNEDVVSYMLWVFTVTLRLILFPLANNKTHSFFKETLTWTRCSSPVSLLLFHHCLSVLHLALILSECAVAFVMLEIDTNCVTPEQTNKMSFFKHPNRTQSHHFGFGQCWKDNHPLPVVSLVWTVWLIPEFLFFFLIPFNFYSFSSHLNTSSLTKEAVHTSPTIGSNVEEIKVRNSNFLVWDIGGQESVRTNWNSYYCNTEVQSTLWIQCFYLYAQHSKIRQQFCFLTFICRGIWKERHRNRKHIIKVHSQVLTELLHINLLSFSFFLSSSALCIDKTCYSTVTKSFII